MEEDGVEMQIREGNQWLSKCIKEDVDNASNNRSNVSNCCIFRVPKLLREGNENAYTPTVVSIGPYHHKDERLRPMEHHKLLYFKSFLTSFEDQPNDYILNSCLEAIQRNQNEIRNCYADPINMACDDDFTRMVLIDSVFIIVFLRRYCLPNQRGNGTVTAEVLRDLLLLENQLPFFIINEIYNISYKQVDTVDNPSGEFIRLVHKCIIAFTKLEVFQDNMSQGKRYCNHLLEFLWTRYEPINLWEDYELNSEQSYLVSPTATSLHEAGVEFQVLDVKECERLLEIRFDAEEGILTIPKLRTEESTMSLFKNMVAYEQCMNTHSTCLTNYFNFLDCLINNPKEVQLLADAGIIENSLGHEFVSDMFNTISKNTRIEAWQYTYWKQSKHMKNHCKNGWNRHKATLREKYFTHPWAMISVISAFVLLIFTLSQAITGILSVPGVLKKKS